MAFQYHIGKIIDVQFMGHAFYNLELDMNESIDVMLKANMINIWNVTTCFFFRGN